MCDFVPGKFEVKFVPGKHKNLNLKYLKFDNCEKEIDKNCQERVIVAQIEI